MWGLLSTSTKTIVQSAPYVQATRYASYLGKLAAFEGSVKSYKRLGRGPASGKGKTSGRGQKGQKARGKVPYWFEGGQTPFFKRFPIIGFSRPHKKVYNELGLGRIQQFWTNGRIPLKEGETLDIRTMRECGLVTGSLKDGVKLLGSGARLYNVPLNIEASKATENVVSVVEKAGHSCTSVYHTKLGLQAHIRPDDFLLKKGYVPLQARPTHKRDIAYYSNPAKGGYLLKDRSLLLDFVGGARSQKKKVKEGVLDRQLKDASRETYGDFAESKIVDASTLGL